MIPMHLVRLNIPHFSGCNIGAISNPDGLEEFLRDGARAFGDRCGIDMIDKHCAQLVGSKCQVYIRVKLEPLYIEPSEDVRLSGSYFF
jgi:hypothetical protein